MPSRCTFPENFVLAVYTETAFRRNVAAFVNSYPTLDVSHEFVKGGYTSSTPIVLQVSLSRDADDEEDEGDVLVVAPHFPGKKMVN
jgi:pre-mRNA-splicing helicase BRR2